MSLFDAGKMCTFSEMTGVVSFNGEPVKNALMKRRTMREKWVEDETQTDASGAFHFPALYERSVAKFLPQEFVVSQEIYVDYNGELTKIWDGVKRKKEENSESQGKPLSVRCDLSWDDEFVKFSGQIFTTKCKWDIVPDKPFSIEDAFEE